MERFRYSGEDDAWCVIVVSLADTGREIAAVGTLAGVRPGENLRLTGRWAVHPRFGEQLRVESFAAVAPATVAGIERYLGSGFVPGIGKELASRLVRKFGARTLEVIEAEPGRLREVEGIGPVRSAQILEVWETQKSIREVMVFLQSYGVSAALANRIFKRYGRDAREVIQKDPFRLAGEIPGIGFATADTIAKNLGMPPSAPSRVEAGILHVLKKRAEEGDTRAPLEALLEEGAKLLSVESRLCGKAVEALAARQEVAIGRTAAGEIMAGIQRLARAEEETARMLARLASADSFASRGPAASSDAGGSQERPDECRQERPDDIARYQRESGITLSAAQREAVERASRDKILVITGGPGTGKTTLITALLRVLQRRGARAALCAPTGRAAKRMSEATGREAQTIHRLLEFNPQKGGFLRGDENPLACDVLVVDESSMIDIELFHSLMKAVPLEARLILVGDADQLPSVGPGNVLADLISSAVVPVIRLATVFRQAEASAIVIAAHRINQGLMPLAAAQRSEKSAEIPRRNESAEIPRRNESAEIPRREDFFFVERPEPAGILETIRELVATRIPRRFRIDPREEV